MFLEFPIMTKQGQHITIDINPFLVASIAAVKIPGKLKDAQGNAILTDGSQICMQGTVYVSPLTRDQARNILLKFMEQMSNENHKTNKGNESNG